MFDRKGLLTEVLGQFRVSRDGIHGTSHWARVRHHALKIGRATGSDLIVAELFAFLHDSQRVNEGTDIHHGKRAAEYAVSLNKKYFDLDSLQIYDLHTAIKDHSMGGIHTHATIQTCWDADRLDLGRVGTKPSAQYLSAEGAKHIADAYRWSLMSEGAEELF